MTLYRAHGQPRKTLVAMEIPAFLWKYGEFSFEAVLNGFALALSGNNSVYNGFFKAISLKGIFWCL